MNRKHLLGGIACLLYILFLLPIFDWDPMMKALSVLVIVQIFWIGKVFPIGFTSLLLILILSFHFFTYEETMSYLGSGVVWLLFSTFIISNAFIESGLAYRISLRMLRWSEGKGRRLIIISYFLMFTLALFVPSNIGRGSLVSSVLHEIVVNLEKVRKVPNLAKALFIGITYTIALSGAVVATGASSTIYAFGILSELYPKLDYLNWIIWFAPPLIIFIFLLWVVFITLHPPESVDRLTVLHTIDQKIGELGKMSKTEYKMFAIIGLTVLLWILQPYHGFSVPLIGMLGACLTMLPGIGIWDWEVAKKSVNWEMILFFASTLMLSQMLIKSGTISWIGEQLVDQPIPSSPYVILVLLLLIVSLLRIVFVNILGFMTIMIPFALSIGEHTAFLSPLIVAMAVFLVGIPGFFLITQSPVHIISYEYGYFKEKDLMRSGIISSIIWVGVVVVSVVYWDLII